ncbi:glycosyltransferase [bacterium]|nr:glycosyltransferase [bacterium]
MNFIDKTTVSKPVFTIVIPVVHSLEDLERCLSSLDNLNYPKKLFQVVLIDCNVLNGLRQFFQERLNKYKFSINTLYLPERHRVKYSWFIESRLHEARNYAIKKLPGRYYVFTLDDCTFEPDWLHKFEVALSEDTGALGGPDILPQGMGWFPRALDCILNSFLGTGDLRRGDGHRESQYYPRKENMVIPANVFNQVGYFSEDIPLGGDMDMAGRIRDAGFQIKFLPENPVWHRRVTTFITFLRLSACTASEKVIVAREHHVFVKSPHFFVLLAIVVFSIMGLYSFVNIQVGVLLSILISIYFIALFFTVVSSIVRSHSLSAGIGVFLLMPFHHLSMIYGIIAGSISKLKPIKGKLK